MFSLKLVQAAAYLYRLALRFALHDLNEQSKAEINRLNSDLDYAESLRKSASNMAVKAETLEDDANAGYEARTTVIANTYHEIQGKLTAIA